MLHQLDRISPWPDDSAEETVEMIHAADGESLAIEVEVSHETSVAEAIETSVRSE